MQKRQEVLTIALVYNDPETDRYGEMGESKAELGVLDEVNAVRQAITEMNYMVDVVPLKPPLERVKSRLKEIRADAVFNLFEGFDGRPETEGEVARMLADLKLPFTGCPGPALALALDKEKTKALLVESGIPTPGHQILNPSNIGTFSLKFPCIVKPINEDASHGLSEDSVVNDLDSLKKQVAKISRLFGGKTIVEEYLDGREFNTTVMGNSEPEILEISEIVYTLPEDKPRILTFEAKWEKDSVYYRNTKAVCPAAINRSERQEIVGIAKAAFKLTGCRGYARVDFRQDRRGRFHVLEVNPNPDIAPDSGAALQSASAGMTYRQFIERIIKLSLEKQQEKR